jgi:hypothetical protein
LRGKLKSHPKTPTAGQRRRRGEDRGGDGPFGGEVEHWEAAGRGEEGVGRGGNGYRFSTGSKKSRSRRPKVVQPARPHSRAAPAAIGPGIGSPPPDFATTPRTLTPAPPADRPRGTSSRSSGPGGPACWLKLEGTMLFQGLVRAHQTELAGPVVAGPGTARQSAAE